MNHSAPGRRGTRFIVAAFVISLLARSGAAASKTSPPEIAFGNGVITVNGITPGADVYLFGVAREPMGYYNSVMPREAVLHDAAKSGRVDYPLGRSVPRRSIWFAVDLTSGLAATATPAGYAARAVELDSRHLKKDVNGDVAKLSYEGMVVDFVVVRPGDGIWGAPVGLHAQKDESADGSNPGAADQHRPVISVVHLEPRAGTTAPPPAKLKNGDVVFIMNSYTSEYSLAIVGAAK